MHPRPSPQSALIPLWQRLASIRHFSFQSRSGRGSVTAWNGRAQGEVAVHFQPDRMEFIERGVLHLNANKRPITIHNHYSWEWNAGRLCLSHCRQGEVVFLVELVASTSKHFKSASPHPCGADQYELEISLRNSQIDAEWRVTGPRKNETIHCRYTA